MDDRLKSKSPTTKPVESTKTRHPDRVTLQPLHLAKIDAWMGQVTSKHRGVHLTRNNVIDWLIGSLPAELSRSDEAALAARFYDEERFLRSVVREMRSRKARGESVSLAVLLEQPLRLERPQGSKRTKRTKTRIESDPKSEITAEIKIETKSEMPDS